MSSFSDYYVVSDLHIGDGGPRDNFAHGPGAPLLDSFLDFVDQQDGRLVICGDLFEFWQANLSKVLVRHEPLLARLARMDTIYVLGNHDADLLYFCRGN
jgi:UDP-2,3-diacylglucosamine pyrophosphatase LpxH